MPLTQKGYSTYLNMIGNLSVHLWRVFARLGRALVKSVIAGIATVFVDGNSVHLHQDDIFHGGQMWKQIEGKKT